MFKDTNNTNSSVIYDDPSREVVKNQKIASIPLRKFKSSRKAKKGKTRV